MSEARKIQDILDRVKRRFRWLTIASGIAGLSAMVVLGLAAEVALDQIFSLPRGIRLLALLGGISFTGWLGTRLLSGPLGGRVNDLFLARSIEGRYSHLKSGLITYIQLSGEGDESAALRELVGERVAGDLGMVRPEIVVPSREARRKALFLGGALLFGLILFAISPSGFWLSFRRSLLPIKNLTETQIAEVLPGNITTFKGKEIEIAVRLTGKHPPTTQLWVTRASADPVRYELPLRGDGWFHCLLPAVTEGFTYSLAANDASSDEYRIRVADVPRLKNLAATFQFPRYTGFPSRRQESGNIDAIEGTQVTLEGMATRPLRSAALVMKDKRVASLNVRGDRFSLGFTLTESVDYAIELVDQEGSADPEPSKYRVVVRKDAPPQVTITVPGKNVELPDPGPVHLAYRVVDDFGLTALRLTAKVNGKNPKALALPVPKERLFLAESTLDLKALGVGPGDYVEYFLTATDNKEPAPQSGESAAYIITIQSTLPLLTFSDAHPDVRVEKYRDPWDRKGSVEPKSEKLLADDRTKDAARTQEPARREQGRKDVVKLEEKKPESKKLDSATEAARKGEPEAGHEDALSKLLEEKKDLIERLLAKAGGKDSAGDARLQGRDGAGAKNGDAMEESADAKKANEAPGAAEGKDELARPGDTRKTGKEGNGARGRAGKNGVKGEGAEAGDGESGGEQADDGQGDDSAQPNAPGQKGAGAKGGNRGPGKPGKAGRPGRPGRGGDGNSGGDGDSGDDDGDEMAANDDDDDYDFSALFPFAKRGGT